ncbi:MAG: ABC transporter ATP-binding protein [Acidobacteriota bacterium]|nr:ABC transporter ATP-binding protein [Acidobacteriota bacterium]
MNDFKRLYPFIRPYRNALLFSLFLLALAGIFQSTTTTLSLPLFDKILMPGQNLSGIEGANPSAIEKYIFFILSLIPGSVITQLSFALLFLTLFKGACLYYSNYSMSRIGQGIVTDLRNALFHHVLGQSMSFFSENSTGRLMSRMGSDVEQVQEAVSIVLAEMVREVILLLSLITVAFFADWKLALLSLLIAPFALGLTLGMGRNIRRVSLRGREDVANLNDHLQQSITGMRIIKAFGMESHEEQGFNRTALKLMRSNLKAASILFLNSPVMELLGVVAFIPLLYYAHARLEAHTLTPGKVGLVIFALFSMYDPIRKLSRIHVQIQRAFASSSRIVELLDTHHEIQDRPAARDMGEFRDSIEFQNVSFDYVDPKGETHVLRDINIRVARNQVIAIVGSSGSGKTTLVGLLPRFYDPTSGSVRIDGVDIREFTQRSLRSQIAMVTQETFLFNDTVRNNIAYGNIHASEAQILEASRIALADDFIMKFPMKYDTVIGERGQRLSGGERQRISIARALLKNAPILILDEATSALDSESEKLVQEALTNLIRNRTTFVIAHRLSTIRNADRILVLDRGRIVESGTHEALMQNEGPYRRFFRLQTEESPDPE